MLAKQQAEHERICAFMYQKCEYCGKEDINRDEMAKHLAEECDQVYTCKQCLSIVSVNERGDDHNCISTIAKRLSATEDAKDTLINHLTSELKKKEQELRELKAAFKTLQLQLQKKDVAGPAVEPGVEVQYSFAGGRINHNYVTLLDMDYMSPLIKEGKNSSQKAVMGQLHEILDDFKHHYEDASWRIISKAERFDVFRKNENDKLIYILSRGEIDHPADRVSLLDPR